MEILLGFVAMLILIVMTRIKTPKIPGAEEFFKLEYGKDWEIHFERTKNV